MTQSHTVFSAWVEHLAKSAKRRKKTARTSRQASPRVALRLGSGDDGSRACAVLVLGKHGDLPIYSRVFSFFVGKYFRVFQSISLQPEFPISGKKFVASMCSKEFLEFH